jgi:putative addiction module killer protein
MGACRKAGRVALLYFTKKNNVIIVLLIGGDKSTQSRDIAKAKMLLKGEDLKND